MSGGRKRIVAAHEKQAALMAEWEAGGCEGDFAEPPQVEPEIWAAWHAEPTHLTHAFRRIGTKMHARDRETKTHLTGDEIVAELSVCEHCAAAYQAVLGRKAARKALATVKRRMSALGRRQIA